MKEGIILEINHLTAIIMTNEGEFLSLPAKPSWQKGNFVKFSEVEIISNRKKEQKTPWIKRKVLIALIASVFFLFIPLSIPSQASTYITLDINPSLEMEIKKNLVESIRPLNDDASLILAGLPKLEDKIDVYQMTELILLEAKELGYLKEDENNYIMVGVIDVKESFKKEQYEAFIQEQLNEEKLAADIIILDGTKEEKKTAEQKGIPYGKYLLQQNQKKEGIEISDEQLIKQGVKEIFEEIKEQEKEKKKDDKNNDKNDDKNDNKNNDKNKDKENNNRDEKVNTSADKKQDQDKTREDKKDVPDNKKAIPEEKDKKENEERPSDAKENNRNTDNNEKNNRDENENVKENQENKKHDRDDNDDDNKKKNESKNR